VNGNLRAVLADDDDDTRRLLGAALAADGRARVIGEATNGEDAVAVVADVQPDLVLLDLGMPGGGGLAALPRLLEVAPGARIVVVSGFPGDRLAAVTRAVGAVGYVTKGLSPKQTVADVFAVADVLDVISAAISAHSARATFDQHVSSAGKARRFMGEKLREWDVEELLETVNLLVSELVTNAVIHAESEAEVAVVLTADALRVEVADRGGGAAVLKDADQLDTSGRGISLVDVLSTRWGIDDVDDGGGKTIWFELEPPRRP
jgi:DNA-binding NarL/FixJ family response regulator